MEIIYFARIRETVGHSSEHLILPENVCDVKGLMDYLQKQGENYAAAFDRRAIIRIAVNEVYVNADHPVCDGDEVAFFPPMTGG